MGRDCIVCNHKWRKDIERDIVQNSYGVVAKKWRLTKASLFRHVEHLDFDLPTTKEKFRENIRPDALRPVVIKGDKYSSEGPLKSKLKGDTLDFIAVAPDYSPPPEVGTEELGGIYVAGRIKQAEGIVLGIIKIAREKGDINLVLRGIKILLKCLDLYVNLAEKINVQKTKSLLQSEEWGLIQRILFEQLEKHPNAAKDVLAALRSHQLEVFGGEKH